ncbi:MAG: HAMP domain-containing sensor histidine kinase [Solirubrobacteraceae bacterium]
MTLRKRLTLIAATTVGVAVLLAAGVSYAVVRSQVRGQVDDALNAQAAVVQRYGELQQGVPGNNASSGGPAPYYQVVLSSGQVVRRSTGGVALPITAATERIAATGTGSLMTDVYVGGSHLRMLCFPIVIDTFNGPTQAVLELARPLNGVDSILRNLRLVLALLLVGGIALAALLGKMASRRVLSPLAEVAQVAEHIGETDDLTERLKVHADDEVGQLATRFNTMLDRLEGSRAALDESMRAQRQLVADASHELRTPVTSLRTNIEVLLAGGELDPEDRRRLLSDVVEQSEELTSLVNDLIELARGDQPGPDTDDVRLDGVAGESLARARRNAPGIRFEATLEPALIDGVPERLGRAINNLLDNAARHSDPDGVVELRVGPEGVRVRDHGPGVPEEDQPYVFDRFFRGTNSRGRQGSGLGLAIVRQVAEQHGGAVEVANAPDGGAVFTLSLAGVAPESADGEDGDQPAGARGTDSRAIRA